MASFSTVPLYANSQTPFVSGPNETFNLPFFCAVILVLLLLPLLSNLAITVYFFPFLPGNETVAILLRMPTFKPLSVLTHCDGVSVGVGLITTVPAGIGTLEFSVLRTIACAEFTIQAPIDLRWSSVRTLGRESDYRC